MQTGETFSYKGAAVRLDDGQPVQVDGAFTVSDSGTTDAGVYLIAVDARCADAGTALDRELNSYTVEQADLDSYRAGQAG